MNERRVREALSTPEELALFATIPTVKRLQDFARSVDTKAENRILLAFEGAATIRFAGFLVTEADFQKPLAFCPVCIPPDLLSPFSREEVIRQLLTAMRVAGGQPQRRVTAGQMITLYKGEDQSPLPAWLYGLSCVPLSENWDGLLIHPRPFCPTFLSELFAQPSAMRWLRLHGTHPTAKDNAGVALQSREEEVLDQLCIGRSEKEIARDLKISKHTVHIYIKRVYQKLQVGSKGELLSLFIDRNRVNQFLRKKQRVTDR